MNRTLAILLLFLSVLFTACQSDEPVIDDGGGKTDGKDLGYIAVSIVQPKSVTGRGASDDGFQDGTNAENEAKEATFFVFDSNGNCKSIQTIGLTGSTAGSSTNKPYTEKIYNAVLVFDNITAENKYSGEIFCVLNATSAIKAYGGTNIEGLNKSDFLKKVGDWCTNCQSAGTFIMTNSAYKETKDETTSEICGTPFTADDFKQSAKAALDAPIDIYVERVVAKVTTNKSSSWQNNGVENPLNKNQTLTIRITGIEIANIAKTAYLFKNLGNVNTTWPTWSISGFDMHDVANKRCYWEDMPNSLEFGNKNYSTIINNATATNKVYPELQNDNYSSNTYIHPNTYRKNGEATNYTCVLVTAQLLNKTTTTGEGGTSTDTYTPADLVWMMGSYIDSIGAKNILCQYLASEQYAVKEVDSDNKTSYTQITNEDLKWTQKQDKSATETAPINDLKDYQAVAQVALKKKENITRTVTKYNFLTNEEGKKSDNTAYTIYDADAYLVSNHKFFAEVFKDGLCYYFVNIDHAGVLGNSKPEDTSYEGVVRNHIYNLELNSIAGIGTAVFDPDKVIVPVIPPHDNFSYLAARINVLPWKLVKQTVDFKGN